MIQTYEANWRIAASGEITFLSSWNSTDFFLLIVVLAAVTVKYGTGFLLVWPEIPLRTRDINLVQQVHWNQLFLE